MKERVRACSQWGEHKHYWDSKFCSWKPFHVFVYLQVRLVNVCPRKQEFNHYYASM